MSGLDLQQELGSADTQIPIIFMTGYGDIPMSVRAMKAGAVEFLTKPFRDEDLLNAVDQAIKRGRQFEQSKNTPTPKQPCPEDELRREFSFSEIVGKSAALCRVLQQVETVAPTDSTVLILGETGAGKELIARALHLRSRRKHKPLVQVNCTSIPKGLFESEFFGHAKGAFTGAIRDRAGRFEAAAGGTLFLRAQRAQGRYPSARHTFHRVVSEGTRLSQTETHSGGRGNAPSLRPARQHPGAA
jgi:DNA-binding NtrC family response regulator